MARPIWQCSGWHWARTALAWLAFVVLLISLADTRGQSQVQIRDARAHEAKRAQLTGFARAAADLQTGSLPEPAVRHTMRVLDVNNLAADAFGDNDVRPTIR